MSSYRAVRPQPFGVVLQSAVLTVGALPCLLAAQPSPQSVRVPDRPSCPTCRIEITPLATFGRGDGPGSFDAYPTSMIADARGRIIVAFSSVATTHLPKVYDASGRFRRQIGAVGEGPGEFRRGELLALGGSDSIFVIDRQLGRRSDFRPDFTFARSALMLPRADAAVRLRTGDWVLNAAVNDRDRAGRSFHLFGPEGAYQRSFGISSGRIDPNPDLSKKVRRMWPARDGGFWSVPWTHKYVIEHWTASGTRTQSIEPASAWFQPYESIGEVRTSPTQAPFGRVTALFEDEAGLVWIVGHAADAKWGAGLGPAQRAEGGTYFPIVDRSKTFDGIVEVFDPRSGTLLARRRVPDPLDFVLRSGVVAGIVEDDDGRLSASAFRLRLVR